MIVRTYSELLRYDTFDDRYEYLKLGGSVGQATFGFDRYIGQSFYSSYEWKNVRQHVILRDNGCDLAMPGYEIHGSLLIHHLNPLDQNDILGREEWILDPEFLITTTHNTHNAIHYGNADLLPKQYSPRLPGDTKLW